jgi:hypothetical protein
MRNGRNESMSRKMDDAYDRERMLRRAKVSKTRAFGPSTLLMKGTSHKGVDDLPRGI